jgi:hypothetical protein
MTAVTVATVMSAAEVRTKVPSPGAPYGVTPGSAASLSLVTAPTNQLNGTRR